MNTLEDALKPLVGHAVFVSVPLHNSTGRGGKVVSVGRTTSCSKRAIVRLSFRTLRLASSSRNRDFVKGGHEKGHGSHSVALGLQPGCRGQTVAGSDFRARPGCLTGERTLAGTNCHSPASVFRSVPGSEAWP